MKPGNVEPHTKRPQHEGSEPVGRNESHDTRSVGRQAQRDLERGLQDTDRRGGDDYQRRTGGSSPDNGSTPKERH
ncbi:hypothetical protein [Paraburkholderia acidisoli]|uniref:Uncharacterized protein n=1 Tax=Paraburkholderia acidisoli TaxID=2571748 RepID=A0A7Z2GNQ1_9BURK|nr:hypothetical protein [Paraburkholderia acidisoli]QGZ64930.1 hypothetical protein FAZ98_24315 [Paraburkholderia acidisoli]